MRVRNQETMLQIKQFIEDYQETHGEMPAQRTIAQFVGLAVSSLNGYLVEMTENGMLSKSGTISRKYLSTKQCDTHTYVPLVGSIACGTPLFAEENIERYITFSSSMLGAGKHFLLRAEGNSMINAGIDDGDLVLVRQQDNAEEGQIVVALIDDSATLKRFYRDRKNKKVRLHPENDNMEDMYFNNVVIQGVAIKVIKDLEC